MLFTIPKNIGTCLFAICLYFLLSGTAFGQITPPDQLSPDTSATSNASAPLDSSLPENAVRFQSSDSLVIDFRSGKKAFLFGSAQVKHSSGELQAGEINVDIDNTTVEARTLTPQDSLSRPVLIRESDEIKSTRILFNYKTEKGKFEEAQVNVAEGNLIGSKIKNVNDTEVFIEDGVYSTCPPEYMYYYLKAKKMKVVDQDELFFSNAQLYILDIPYPIIFPFGYVPTDIEKKRSGLLTPTYAFQDQQNRGLGLQNVGWFQYFNDYLTGQVSGDIYTSGTIYLNSSVQYRNTDEYSGSVQFGYSKDRGLEPTDPGYTETTQKSLSLQHSQTISPFASLSANVNLRTADYNRRNSYDIDDRAETNSSSRISYNYKHPENLFTFSTNTQLVQNFTNFSTRVSGPTMNFRLKTISPFQSNSGGGEQSWYESISLSYDNTLRSRFNFDPIDADSSDISFFDALTDPDLYEEATGNDDYIQAGFQQSASVRVGRLIPSRYLNTSANFNLEENWYPSYTQKTFNADSNRVEEEKKYGFKAGREFSTGLSFSTTFYGVSNIKIGNFEGFRHTVRPSIGFSYSPDFSTEKWGYYRTVQTDTSGTTQKYSIFEDQIFGGPGRGEVRSLNFSVNNNFETKLVKRDSTGEVSEKNIRFIDNLSLSSSYNFAADSLKLSDLNARISSSAISGLNLSANARFSFYQFNENGREVDKFFIEEGKKLAQLQSFSLNASTSFRGGQRGVEVFTPVYRKRYDPFNQSRFEAIDPNFGYEPIAPISSPWSISLNFSYSWNYRFGEDPQKRATLRASNISFNLTPKWQFNTDMGYDFIAKEFTPSQFSLRRNLECWDLSFQINPFGEFQYYFFRLSVNSSQIQSLFQKLPILKNLERSSSPSGRGRRGGGIGGGPGIFN
ncbi:putative LPS assembly protein LptD [Gracilimonas sp.]|uniref:putative LPS assembly protein LptD n=1 Tax=Gracilimonas sp. TaxID=1974203 RepID=UPI0028724828|nr:putative LPS assembly protein LptD [Gracilimonas sp.]